MKEKYVVYEISEEEIKEIAGGNILPPQQSILCDECHYNIASVNGFVVKNIDGKNLEIKYRYPWCESCAQKEVDIYVGMGWEFVGWL